MPDVFFSDELKKRVAEGDFDWESDDIRALLLDGSQATDRTRVFVDELSGEHTDGSYSRVTVDNRVSELNDTPDPNTRRLTADDVVFSELDGEDVADRMVMFKHVTNDTDSWIIGYFEVRRGGSAIVPTGESLSIPPLDSGFISVEE